MFFTLFWGKCTCQRLSKKISNGQRLSSAHKRITCYIPVECIEYNSLEPVDKYNKDRNARRIILTKPKILSMSCPVIKKESKLTKCFSRYLYIKKKTKLFRQSLVYGAWMWLPQRRCHLLNIASVLMAGHQGDKPNV